MVSCSLSGYILELLFTIRIHTGARGIQTLGRGRVTMNESESLTPYPRSIESFTSVSADVVLGSLPISYRSVSDNVAFDVFGVVGYLFRIILGDEYRIGVAVSGHVGDEKRWFDRIDMARLHDFVTSTVEELPLVDAHADVVTSVVLGVLEQALLSTVVVDGLVDLRDGDARTHSVNRKRLHL